MHSMDPKAIMHLNATLTGRKLITQDEVWGLHRLYGTFTVHVSMTFFFFDLWRSWKWSAILFGVEGLVHSILKVKNRNRWVTSQQIQFWCWDQTWPLRVLPHFHPIWRLLHAVHRQWCSTSPNPNLKGRKVSLISASVATSGQEFKQNIIQRCSCTDVSWPHRYDCDHCNRSDSLGFG